MLSILPARGRSVLVAISLALLAALAFVPAALAGTITVDGNCTDTNLATALCDDNTTYRTIAGAAGAATAGDTLNLVTSPAHTEAGVTITKSVAIQGQGQNTTIWQAALSPNIAATRLFTVNPGVAVTVTAITLQYGNSPTDGGAIYNQRGTLTLDSVNVFTSTATDGGGAIYNYAPSSSASLFITNSVFSGNQALAFPGGGAILSISTGGTANVAITNTQFISNASSYDGGALVSYANSGATNLTITGSQFVSNTASGTGGGVQNFANNGTANATVASSQFTGNSAGDDGGGLSSFANGGSATLTLTGNQFTGNSAGGKGGGLSSFANGGSAALTLTGSQFTGNFAGSNGGGLSSFANGGLATASVTSSQFYTNTSNGFGGGLSNFANANSASLALSEAWFSGNVATGSTGGGGGGVANFGGSALLAVTNTTFYSNTVMGSFPYGGGGLLNFGSSGTAQTTLTSVQFLSNTTTGQGGALYNEGLRDGGVGALHVLSSTLAYNTASGTNGGGGAIYNYAYVQSSGTTRAQLLLTDTVVYHNAATGSGVDGGAVFTGALDTGSFADFTAVNSTFSHNTAAGTAAIYNDILNRDNFTTTITFTAASLVTLTQTTLYSNTAGSGGGALYVDGFALDEYARTALDNTLVSGNSGNECSGSGDKAGASNYIDDTSCGSSASFRLGSAAGTVSALADNGGPTLTHALTNASPAVNSANGTYCPATDQRGTARPQGSGCDVGAWEGAPVTPTLFISGTPPSGFVSASYAYTFTTNGFLVTFTVQSGTLPPGLALNPNGVLSGTPTLAGTYNGLVVRASDGLNTVDTSSLSVMISQVITVTANPPDGQVGVFYTYTIPANISPLTYTLQAGTLPPGLTLGSNGILSGTPTTAGTYSGLVFRGANAGGYDDSDPQTIIITQTVGIVANPPDGQVGTHYSYALGGTGNPLTFTVASGSLPPGLSLTSAGVLTGTPTLAGTYSGLVFRANNGYDTDDSAPQTIIITETVTLTANPPNGMVDEPYSYFLSASGATPSTFELVSGTLPPGLTLDEETGEISGTPTLAGTYSGLVFRADNGYATDDSPERTIVIEEAAGTGGYKLYLPGIIGPPVGSE